VNRPAIIVHGGAWHIPDGETAAWIAGCREAAGAGWEILETGGSSLDAVEAAVRILEDNPLYDAGRGSLLTRDGRVQLDAIVMEGRSLQFGAVAAVERIRHPISLARMILERCEHSFVVGQGAEELAALYGVPFCDPAELLGRRDPGTWSPPAMANDGLKGRLKTASRQLAVPQQMGDTVGAVALDAAGRLTVGTSTGGTPDKWPGRVGDSPLVGCGAYADDQVGAAAATGSGESLMRIVTSKTAVDYLAQGMTAQEAADATIRRLWERVRGYGGVILIDSEGRIGLAHNTPNLSYAYVAGGEAMVGGAWASTEAMPGRAAGLAAIRG
jgi:L-asparaginase / beta-aspartyl-peptidase